MVRASLAVVTDKLHAANHFANGEESENLCQDNATGGELDCGEISYGVEQILRRGENAAGADRVPGVLVEGLEGSGGAGVS